jgi:uncharacterized SAM-binding protein YcdF (DUF218 family)
LSHGHSVARAARYTTTLVCLVSCAGARPLEHGASVIALDVVVVPGCPNLDDGHLSRCQEERIVSAAFLWEQGRARNFIVSGAAVHTPYEEARSLAEGMALLGVPPERIMLDSEALHTDENMFNALLIARAMRWRTMGVASQSGHATMGCKMLAAWGQPCQPLPTDRAQAIARHEALGAPLDRMIAQQALDWLPLDERERARAERSGGRVRRASFLHYMWLMWLGANGETWTPALPESITLATLADLRAGTKPRTWRPVDPLGGTRRASPGDSIF